MRGQVLYRFTFGAEQSLYEVEQLILILNHQQVAFIQDLRGFQAAALYRVQSRLHQVEIGRQLNHLKLVVRMSTVLDS